MDARAMEDHDWDACGVEIAKLFEGDRIKQGSINDAWWNDLDDDEQELIHEFVCENKRGPDGLEAVQRFERFAGEREKRARKHAEEMEKLRQQKEAAVAKHANLGNTVGEYQKAMTESALAAGEAFAQLSKLVNEHMSATRNGVG